MIFKVDKNLMGLCKEIIAMAAKNKTFTVRDVKLLNKYHPQKMYPCLDALCHSGMLSKKHNRMSTSYTYKYEYSLTIECYQNAQDKKDDAMLDQIRFLQDKFAAMCSDGVQSRRAERSSAVLLK